MDNTKETEAVCGIAGLVRTAVEPPETPAANVERMIATLVHRGPDDSGLWGSDLAAFGHRRLSIIDLETGTQPMVGDSGCVIVFNGEIYNYLELKVAMEARGRQFRTTSDTEVLLALYEEKGRACLDDLVGMFAFAIWDPGSRELFLARDRLGKKPLYYCLLPGMIAFASEIKALLTVAEVQAGAEINPLALSDYLSFGYVLTPKTIFRNIAKLPAAHTAVWKADSEMFATNEYWDPAPLFTGDRRPYDKTALEEFAYLLDEAVRIRLRSDVPLGVFLSGGLDSSAIAAATSHVLDRAPQAFAVGFPQDSFDETPYAREVAEHLRLPFEVLTAGTEMWDSLPQLVWQTDEPFADTSILSTSQLCKAARQRVKVAVSGDGGDELLAGYPTYMADAIYAIWRHTPRLLQEGLYQLAKNTLRPSYRKVSWDYKARQFLGARGLNRARAHSWWRTIFSAEEKKALMAPWVLEACGDYDPLDVIDTYFRRVEKADFLSQSSYVDIKSWLQDDILVKVDRMSMAHSLEVRSPLLDHRLIEFMSGLEPNAKMRGRKQKVILRDLVRSKLPHNTLARSKQGFGAPVIGHPGVILCTDGLGGLMQPGIQLDPSQEDVTYKAFALTVLAQWVKMHSGLKNSGKWERVDVG